MSAFENNLRWLGLSDANINLEHFEALNDLANRSGQSLQNLLFHNLSATGLPWHQVKLVVLDVDGVMTEGGMHYTAEGTEFKRFDTKDGMAIKRAMSAGYEIAIASSGINAGIVQQRADVLGISRVFIGTTPKHEAVAGWLAELGFTWEQCAAVGDDLNDEYLLTHCAVSGAPADATGAAKAIAKFILSNKGGFGCVREFLSYLPNLALLK